MRRRDLDSHNDALWNVGVGLRRKYTTLSTSFRPQRGNDSLTRGPPDGRFVSVRSPRWACTIDCAIARPRPTPPVSGFVSLQDERVEYARELLLRDSGPFIINNDFDRSRRRLDRHACGLAVFGRIVEDVADRALQGVRMTVVDNRFGWLHLYIYGTMAICRMRAMGIRKRHSASVQCRPRWSSGFNQYPVNSSGVGGVGTFLSSIRVIIVVSVSASLSNPPCEFEAVFPAMPE